MNLKKEMYEIEDSLKQEIENISHYIFMNPELGKRRIQIK